MNQVRGDLPQGDKHELSPLQPGVRDLQTIAGMHEAVVQEDVDIDLAGSPPPGDSPPQRLLNSFDLTHQRGRVKRSLDLGCGVQEFPLCRVPIGLGLIHRRAPHETATRKPRDFHRRTVEKILSCPEIRSQAQEHAIHHRDCVISTSTKSITPLTGGCGFRIRTVTVSML